MYTEVCWNKIANETNIYLVEIKVIHWHTWVKVRQKIGQRQNNIFSFYWQSCFEKLAVKSTDSNLWQFIKKSEEHQKFVWGLHLAHGPHFGHFFPRTSKSFNV